MFIITSIEGHANNYPGRRRDPHRTGPHTPEPGGHAKPLRATGILAPHPAVPENKSGIDRKIHACATVIGKIAAEPVQANRFTANTRRALEAGDENPVLNRER